MYKLLQVTQSLTNPQSDLFPPYPNQHSAQTTILKLQNTSSRIGSLTGGGGVVVRGLRHVLAPAGVADLRRCRLKHLRLQDIPRQQREWRQGQQVRGGGVGVRGRTVAAGVKPRCPCLKRYRKRFLHIKLSVHRCAEARLSLAVLPGDENGDYFSPPSTFWRD